MYFFGWFSLCFWEKTKTNIEACTMNAARFFSLFFLLFFVKNSGTFEGKKFHPEKTLASILHQALPLLSTCFSLLFGRLSPHSWVPFKSPFSFKMQLTLRIMFLRRLKRETTPWVDYSSIGRNIKKFPFQQALNNQRNKSCFWQTSIEIFKEFPLD